MRSALITVLLYALMFPLVSVSDDTVELDQNRARWQAAGMTDYRYGYRKHCECYSEAPPETVVTVLEGRVADVRHRPEGASLEVTAAESSLEWYWTIDDLFGLVRTALERNATVRVRYHEQLGYPLGIYIDYGTDHASDVLDLRLTRLERYGE